MRSSSIEEMAVEAVEAVEAVRRTDKPGEGCAIDDRKRTIGTREALLAALSLLPAVRSFFGSLTIKDIAIEAVEVGKMEALGTPPNKDDLNLQNMCHTLFNSKYR